MELTEKEREIIHCINDNSHLKKYAALYIFLVWVLLYFAIPITIAIFGWVTFEDLLKSGYFKALFKVGFYAIPLLVPLIFVSMNMRACLNLIKKLHTHIQKLEGKEND